MWTAVGAILLTGVVVYLLNILSVPVSILIWTVILVFCLRGIVNALDARGVNRTVGTAVAYAVLCAVVGLVGFLMFSPMFGLNSQLADLVASVPQLTNDLIAWGNDVYLRYAPVLEDETVRSLIQDVQGSLAAWASSFAQVSATGLVNVGATVANGLMAFGFALVIAFWVLMELPALGREVKRLVGPKRAEDAEFLHYTFTRIMGGYIKATILQCAVIGVACGVLFAVVGIPNASALGVITGVLNIIPIIGPWLGGMAAAITAVFVSPFAALVALVGTVAIQQFVYTFISPRIMADSVDVHPALTLIALMCGSALGGAMSGLLGALVGMLASIPAVAVVKACFVYYFEKRTGRCLVAEDGVFFKGTPAEGDVPDPMADATSPHPGSTASFLPVELDEGGQPTGKLRRPRFARRDKGENAPAAARDAARDAKKGARRSSDAHDKR
ncbi:AI-2E family transporter [Adlercreutzia sp. ZJ473]|uniref:AI-2E family transporter n=1 Tax=Adlercreutzia sp. ZJ473 TaxID=2722822 RepID=UPI0015561BAB